MGTQHVGSTSMRPPYNLKQDKEKPRKETIISIWGNECKRTVQREIELKIGYDKLNSLIN